MIDEGELDVFREGLRQAIATGSGVALDDALGKLGWRDALRADRRVAVSILFELLGRNDATASAIDLVVADPLGRAADDAGAVLPPLGSVEPPGRVEAATLTVDGIGTAGVVNGDQAVLVARSGGDDVVVTIDTADLEVRPLEGLDRGTGLAEVTARVGVDGAVACAPGAWEHAVAAGQRALSHQLVGASRAMLELAGEHARDRVQFGRPIAAFQAVRHRLADCLVAVEAADAALAASWDDGSTLTAALAKAVAGRCARTVAGNCQQVLAGMGFTTEHPFHRYLRRSILLDQLLGDRRTLFRRVGEDLLRSGELPTLLPL